MNPQTYLGQQVTTKLMRCVDIRTPFRKAGLLIPSWTHKDIRGVGLNKQILNQILNGIPYEIHIGNPELSFILTKEKLLEIAMNGELYKYPKSGVDLRVIPLERLKKTNEII